MSSNGEWLDELPPISGRGGHRSGAKDFEPFMKKPGKWGTLATYPKEKQGAAYARASNARSRKTYPEGTTAKDFESAVRFNEKDETYSVFVRYVGSAK